MFYRFRQAWHRARFRSRVRGVLDLTPVQTGSPDGPTLVTQVCHADVFMYLAAIQSLARYVRPQHVFVLDDLSLQDADKALLRKCVRDLEIVRADEVRNEACPARGCWERLLLIADLVEQGHYVVQLDADTLTLRDPLEVRRFIEEGVSFTLGTGQGRSIVPMGEAQGFAAGKAQGDNPHIQVLAEAGFDRLRDFQDRRYVRGNAGFAGFGPKSFGRETVEAFSKEMTGIVGRRWNEWGSEQLTSNFIVSNSPRAEVLPYPAYSYHGTSADTDGITFLHFIGTYRFYKGHYAALCRELITELLAGTAHAERT